MLKVCVVCGWKADIVKWKQKYRCKNCNKNQAETDSRVKSSYEERKYALIVSGGLWISENCENFNTNL